VVAVPTFSLLSGERAVRPERGPFRHLHRSFLSPQDRGRIDFVIGNQPQEVFMSESSEDGVIYRVVVNHEEQYSIWPADRDNPLGWRDEGKSGTKAECLAHIEVVWTDMRPLSLRKRMEEAAKAKSAGA
jgi:MbtH protein